MAALAREDLVRDMGHWGYPPNKGLTMSSGQAALIQLAQEIDLPYFPIAVEKAWGYKAIQKIVAKF